jgi:hypothetical protein
VHGVRRRRRRGRDAHLRRCVRLLPKEAPLSLRHAPLSTSAAQILLHMYYPSSNHLRLIRRPHIRFTSRPACAGADCERGCHTYCAGLDEVPEDEWYCWECAARAAHGADARAPVSSSRRRGAGEARRGAGEAMRSASPPAGELARSRRRGPGVRQRQGQHVEGEQSVSPEAASPSSPARQRRRLVLRCGALPLPLALPALGHMLQQSLLEAHS